MGVKRFYFKFLFVLWCDCKWSDRVFINLNCFSHRLHVYIEGFEIWVVGWIGLLCLDRMCLVRLSFLETSWSHKSHLYLTPSCTDFICTLRACSTAYCFSHCSQEYFMPSCTALTCFSTIFFNGALKSHWLHWNVTPLCLDWMWVIIPRPVRSDKYLVFNQHQLPS